jgi:ribonuclease HII
MSMILGIDEAGRGPLAGPVAVGIVSVSGNVDLLARFKGLNDSKKLTERTRERIYEEMLELEQSRYSSIRFCVEFGSSQEIDEEGISAVIARLVAQGVKRLAPKPDDVKVYLDGALQAPGAYTQETIIGGDGLIGAIMLASVMAKVSRDRLMIELAKQYPEYAFEKHKGYGTKQHMQALREYGMCAIHRVSYIHIDL